MYIDTHTHGQEYKLMRREATWPTRRDAQLPSASSQLCARLAQASLSFKAQLLTTDSSSDANNLLFSKSVQSHDSSSLFSSS